MAKKVVKPGLTYLSALLAAEYTYGEDHTEIPVEYLPGQRLPEERPGELRLNAEAVTAITAKAYERKRRQEEEWEGGPMKLI